MKTAGTDPPLLPAAAVADRATTRTGRSSPTAGRTSERALLLPRASSRPTRAQRAVHPGLTTPASRDAVTTSGSGVDPHISEDNAAIQARRVAARPQHPARARAAARRGQHRRALPRPARRARRERDQAQPRPGSMTATRPHPRPTPTPRRSKSLFTPEILWPAIGASFKKLDPRVQVRNPVMFVVEIGAVDHDDRVADPAVRRRALAAATSRAGSPSRRRLAVADGRLRQPRRGAGRGPRPRAGRLAARDAFRDHGAAGRRRRASPPPSCSAVTSSSSRPARSSPATAP